MMEYIFLQNSPFFQDAPKIDYQIYKMYKCKAASDSLIGQDFVCTQVEDQSPTKAWVEDGQLVISPIQTNSFSPKEMQIKKAIAEILTPKVICLGVGFWYNCEMAKHFAEFQKSATCSAFRTFRAADSYGKIGFVKNTCGYNPLLHFILRGEYKKYYTPRKIKIE